MSTRRAFLAVLFLACSASAQTPTEYWRVDPWQYWTATPTFIRMCNSADHCYSNAVAADRHILGYQDNGIYGITTVLPAGVGVTRDYVGGELRCFSNTPGSCLPLATFPPSFSPTFDYVPVLAAVGTTAPTPGAKLYYANQTFQVNAIDTGTCAVTYIGPITHSGAHFMLASLDLGGSLGVVENVYVTEEYSGIPPGAASPTYGSRMERYFFAPGLGRVRQEGWNDPSCVDAATCLGNYTVPAPAAGVWTPAWDAPVAPVAQELCP